jgi:hypothetical protein
VNICLGYCIADLSNIQSQNYQFNISKSGQALLSSYAKITNPSNCKTTYTLSNSPDNSTYTENDLVIDANSGVLYSKANNIFQSQSIQITVTATFAAFNCSATATSVGFTVE